MKKSYKFDATILNAGGGGAYIRIPFDVEKTFGKKRVPVNASIDGEKYRGTLTRYGEPNHILVILKDIRNKIGKDVGDMVAVTLEEDIQPRIVEIPEDLQVELDNDPAASIAFRKLAYSHQREHVNAILDAKRPETRARRIKKTMDILSGLERN